MIEERQGPTIDVRFRESYPLERRCLWINGTGESESRNSEEEGLPIVTQEWEESDYALEFRIPATRGFLFALKLFRLTRQRGVRISGSCFAEMQSQQFMNDIYVSFR
ncbi:unnamed protein product, partial [Porites evermanni]